MSLQLQLLTDGGLLLQPPRKWKISNILNEFHELADRTFSVDVPNVQTPSGWVFLHLNWICCIVLSGVGKKLK
jgi:hypothetical protein